MASPSERIALMVERNQLSIESSSVSSSISSFLANNSTFDFAAYRVDDFEEQVKAIAGDDSDAVRSELMKIQRVFQVSPTPEVEHPDEARFGLC